MIVDAESDQVLYPESRTLEFGNGDRFALYCHSTEKDGNYLDLDDGSDDVTDYLVVSCNDGAFVVDGDEFDLLEVSCRKRIEPRITKIFDEKTTCANQGADGRQNDLIGNLHTVEIGWQVRDTYTKMIELCIDEKVYGTLWTKHNVYGKSIYHNDHNKRPGFKADNYYEHRFFNFSSTHGMNHLYSRNAEAEVVERILGTSTLPDGTTIISSRGSRYSWNRGHISPDADFVMDYQQDATYFFINLAPQFGYFNQDNWLHVENAVRSKSNQLDHTTQVTSGTYGTLAYPDARGEPTELYLFYDPDSSPAATKIPVPKYYWKVLYDDQSHSAVAFLGLNDIYANDITKTQCPSVCDQLSQWVDFDYNDVKAGHITCCSLDTFASVVPYAPQYKDENGNWPQLLV